MTTQRSLNEALAIAGIIHRPSRIEGKRDWFNKSGEHIGTYDAHEGWQALQRAVAAETSRRAA